QDVHLMMEILDRSSGKVLGIKVSGKLLHQDYQRFVPMLEALISARSGPESCEEACLAVDRQAGRANCSGCFGNTLELVGNLDHGRSLKRGDAPAARDIREPTRWP
ncbi:MAG: hypothetical protein ACLP7Q_06030, partial [Isosphaeraceae bacterium]